LLNLKFSFFYNKFIKQLKLSKILEIISKNAKEIGKKTFQPKRIN